ncbi:DUF3106 domain-containing protein [Cognatiluteimonas profundi]|uniref:DUF3106 domain-containing protein n=1 Tax=Cognatiluteimonas profundi TaxID=2594501 RepID=UPI00131A8A11|nr:DUF3106 domain-containing protein [Lysobacter profundi]
MHPSRLFPLLLALLAGPAFAGQPLTLPPWDGLTPAQRDMLVAPLREHWNADPLARPRLMQRAQRWQQLTPEQRARAHHGFDRWQSMDPAKRQTMRALFHAMRGMSPAQRQTLRQQWQAMTPAQREAWVQAHAPSGD